MERAEFDRLIAQYPVVRTSDSRRDWHTRVSGSNESAAATTSAITAPLRASPMPVSSGLASQPQPSASTSGDFFTSLQSYLERTYSPDVARRIGERFRTSHTNSLKGLSLDEIEIIATSIKRAREQRGANTNFAIASASTMAVQPDTSAMMID